MSSATLPGDDARSCSAVVLATLWALTAVVAALTLAPSAAHSQTVSTAVNLSIPTILYINGDGTSLNFPAPTDANYVAGYVTSTSGPTLTHRGNVPYGISIQAQSGTYMDWVTDPGYPAMQNPHKLFSDLTLRATTGGSSTAFVALGSPGAANLLYTRAGGKGGSTLTTAIDARMALDYSKDPPGTYSTTVVFTIVAQ